MPFYRVQILPAGRNLRPLSVVPSEVEESP